MENELSVSGKRLAIIGAGMAGLISAKYASEMGFTDIKVFEKKNELGGNWTENCSPIWPDLYTNLSKYLMQFFDFIWRDTDKMFSSKTQVRNFLYNYAKNFNVLNYIQFNTEVLKVDTNNFQGGMKDFIQLTYKTDNDKICKENFDFLIISTGFFSTPDFSEFEKYKNSEIEIIHTSQYKHPEYFRDKVVMSLGISHSSAQLSAEISTSAKQVINVFRDPYYIFPQWIYSKLFDKYVPFDFIFFKLNICRAEAEDEKYKCLTQNDKNKICNNYFSSLTDQNKIHPSLQMNKDSTYLPKITISNEYLKCVTRNLIKPIKSEVANIKGKKVILKNGESFDIDVLLLGTGYKSNLNILDEKTLKIISYNPNNKQAPVNLAYNVFHPNLKNIAFVGFNFLLVFFNFEMQAKVALKYFTNPSQFNKNLCKENESLYFSNNKLIDFIEYIEMLARVLNMLPDWNKLKLEDEELFDMIKTGPLLPQIFLLNEKGELREKAVTYIKKVNSELKKSNQF